MFRIGPYTKVLLFYFIYIIYFLFLVCLSVLWNSHESELFIFA